MRSALKTGRLYLSQDYDTTFSAPKNLTKVAYFGKYLFSPCGGRDGSEISLINCFADLNESAEIVSEGLTPTESGIIEPSITYKLG